MFRLRSFPAEAQAASTLRATVPGSGIVLYKGWPVITANVTGPRRGQQLTGSLPFS